MYILQISMLINKISYNSVSTVYSNIHAATANNCVTGAINTYIFTKHDITEILLKVALNEFSRHCLEEFNYYTCACTGRSNNS
jgi:hypothetical protein